MPEPALTNVRSMTGQGRASGVTDRGAVTVEIRTVNHRGFKLSLRSPDAFSGLDGKIEAAIRKVVHRGSCSVSIGLENTDAGAPSQINTKALAGYLSQCLDALRNSDAGPSDPVSLDVASLLGLPGVLTNAVNSDGPGEDSWQQVQPVLNDALNRLVEMRCSEGENMAKTLAVECLAIEKHVATVSELAPRATENHRLRLESKVKRVLQEHDLAVESVDLLREVQIYADKSDVSEEVTRLASHIELFVTTLTGAGATNATDPVGRKLDFIIQEMFRETNTIGSKAAHKDTSSVVVEIKCALERMRELVQNLE